MTTHLAYTTNPQIAHDIQRRNPGSWIDHQNGHYNIYTNQGPTQPATATKPKPNHKKTTTQKPPGIIDRLPWWLLAAGVIILLFSIM